MVNQAELVKLSQVSSFFHTEKSIGLIQFSEPKRLAFLNDDNLWESEDTEFKDAIEPIISELNTTKDRSFALDQIKKIVIKNLTAYYLERQSFFQEVVNQLKTKVIIELSGSKSGTKLLDKVNEYFDDLSSVTQSKGLQDLAEMSEFYHIFNSLFLEFSSLMITKRKAIRYIKELVKVLKGTGIAKDAGKIDDDNTKVEFAKSNMEKILDESTILDFEECSDIINTLHIISAIHAKEYDSAKEVIGSFNTAVK
jgi:hypothetical protein